MGNEAAGRHVSSHIHPFTPSSLVCPDLNRSRGEETSACCNLSLQDEHHAATRRDLNLSVPFPQASFQTFQSDQDKTDVFVLNEAAYTYLTIGEFPVTWEASLMFSVMDSS